MGCTKKVQTTTNPNEKAYWALPKPLEAGAPKRLAPDGSTTLYTPDWDRPVVAPQNEEFVEAASDQVLDKCRSGKFVAQFEIRGMLDLRALH